MELLLFLLGGGVVVSAAKSAADLCSCSLIAASLSLSSTTLLVSWLLGAAGEKQVSAALECWLSVGPGVRHVGGWWIDCNGGGWPDEPLAKVSTPPLRRDTKSVRESPPLNNRCCWLSACCCCWLADHSLPKISSRISIEWCGLATGTAGASIITEITTLGNNSFFFFLMLFNDVNSALLLGWVLTKQPLNLYLFHEQISGRLKLSSTCFDCKRFFSFSSEIQENKNGSIKDFFFRPKKIIKKGNKKIWKRNRTGALAGPHPETEPITRRKTSRGPLVFRWLTRWRRVELPLYDDQVHRPFFVYKSIRNKKSRFCLVVLNKKTRSVGSSNGCQGVWLWCRAIEVYFIIS